LETKLNHQLTISAARSINPVWILSYNFGEAPYGLIIVLHNPFIFSLLVILSTRQAIHHHVTFIPSHLSFYLTVVFADNSIDSRQNLFNLLPAFRQESHPWLVLGDFNCCLSFDVKYDGIPLYPREIYPLTMLLLNPFLCL